MTTVPPDPTDDPAVADTPEVRALYRERARLVAYITSQHPAVLAYNDRNWPTWPVLYVDTPRGQLSWHIAEFDLDLFSHIERVGPNDPRAEFDGHDTAEKHARLARLTGDGVTPVMAGARVFALVRDTDHTGVSGTGTIAYGVQWPDGTVALRWHGDHASTVVWASLGDALAIHGHDGATRPVWLYNDPWGEPADAIADAATTVKATGGAVEINGVRIEPCDERGQTDTTRRAQAAEAELERVRVQLAGCAVAAAGGDEIDDQRAAEGAYGWSPAYRDVAELYRYAQRVKADRDSVIERIRDTAAALTAGADTFSDVERAMLRYAVERFTAAAHIAPPAGLNRTRHRFEHNGNPSTRAACVCGLGLGNPVHAAADPDGGTS